MTDFNIMDVLYSMWKSFGSIDKFPEDIKRDLNYILDKSLVANMMRSKFKVMGIPINFDDMYLILLDLSVQGNPGDALTITYYILVDILTKGKYYDEYVITMDDWMMAFGKLFMLNKDEEIRERMTDLWHNQKICPVESGMSDNLFDYSSFWHDVISHKFS